MHLSRRTHPLWSQCSAGSGQGIPCSTSFSDASSTVAASPGTVLGAAPLKHPEGPEFGEVTATATGLPVSPNPGHPFAPSGRSPSPPRQGADPEEPLTFVGEAKARGMLLPCGAAAQLLQEEAEQECGQGQPVARGSPHGGTGEWAGSACPHSTMVQRRDATSNAGCKQRRGKAAAVLTAPVWALGRQLWLDTHLPSTSLGAPGHSLSREFTGQLFQPA